MAEEAAATATVVAAVMDINRTRAITRLRRRLFLLTEHTPTITRPPLAHTLAQSRLLLLM